MMIPTMMPNMYSGKIRADPKVWRWNRFLFILRGWWG